VLLGAKTDFSSTAMGGNGSTNSYNIGIGYDALINGERVYSCVIGSNARVSSNNSFVIGGTTPVTRMSVGIGTDTPDQDASIELAENDKGFLINRLSNSEKTTFATALNASDEGMMVYDSTSQHLSIWNGSQWLLSGVQNLTLSSNILSITDGNSVNLSSYLDNTDAQDLDLSGNILSLTNDGTTVDLSGYLDNTDTQNLSFTGTSLSIDNGNTIDLVSLQDGYEANTDEQTLALSGTDLSISNGNSIDLSSLVTTNTDEQDLVSAILTGSVLEIDIENGSSVSVDLSPLLTDLEARVTALEDAAGLANNKANNKAVIYQNNPNPYKKETSIGYYIPENVRTASLLITNIQGVVIREIPIHNRKSGSIIIDKSTTVAGTYFYTLVLDDKRLESKIMIKVEN